MFNIQGTAQEKAKIQNLLDILQKTKTGQKVFSRINSLLGDNPLILKFDEKLPGRGFSERGRISLNPKMLAEQNECVSTLGHELVHTMMRDVFVMMLQNASSLDEYTLTRLLWEGHAWMIGDLILQGLNPQPKCKNEGAPWYKTVDLTTKEGRTLYLQKALMVETGWAESEVQKVNKSHKFSNVTNPNIFKKACGLFLEEMDTSLPLYDVLQTRPYSNFTQQSSNVWKKFKKLLSR